MSHLAAQILSSYYLEIIMWKILELGLRKWRARIWFRDPYPCIACPGLNTEQ